MLKLDLHIHTNFSDGIATPEAVVDYARQMGLDGVAITDHNKVEGSLRGESYAKQFKDFIVITGVEVDSIAGHILGLGVRENIEEYLSVSETVDKIHELGGIAIAPHPFDFYRNGIGEKAAGAKFDALEMNSRSLLNWRTAHLAKRLGLPLVGGSDSHILDSIGSAVTFVDAELDTARILAAIKGGKTEVDSRFPVGSFLKEIKTRKLKMLKKTIFMPGT